MTTTEITKFGDSLGIVLPQEVLERLGVQPGDQVQMIATDEGVTLKPCDDTVRKQLDVAEKVMEKRHDVLRRLAE